jgi:Domain of unknown function (DUF6438)
MGLQRLFALLPLVLTCLIQPSQGYLRNDDQDLSSLSDADLKTVVIQFERTVCFGTCPAYTVTVHGDGNVQYVGKDHVKVKGAKEETIDAAIIKNLMSEFARAKFLSLPEDYTEEKCKCRRCTDMPSAITEISVRGTKHRVNHYYGCGCAPKALFDLESAIDKAVRVEQWTGDVSKQGPFGTTCFG